LALTTTFDARPAKKTRVLDKTSANYHFGIFARPIVPLDLAGITFRRVYRSFHDARAS